ncbi:hypothetical protein OAP14_08920 [Aliiglaciecola sp.]|nr:hypothetical protein [Aliiglaciecola sp.]
MLTIHSILFACHIILGSLALLLFWVPIVAGKGGLNHIKFGRYYAHTMYAVALSGALMAVLVLYDPLAIKGHLIGENTDQRAFVNTIRIFWGFLLYLSLLTYVSVKQGVAVLKHKNSTAPLRTISHLGPIILLALGGVIILTLGTTHGRVLHIVFGILGIMIGTGMLRYCFAQQLKPKQWLIEHLGGMIGSGIGAYTAFIAFGGRKLFADLGSMQIIFWVAPGVIGSIAIYLLSKKYQPKNLNS